MTGPADPEATTAAPNNTTGASETAIAVPDAPETSGEKHGHTEVPKSVPSTLSAPLTELALSLPELISESSHSEVWGVKLTSPEKDIPTQIILQKYLNANDGDVAKAKAQLQATLQWRAKIKPLELIQRKFNKDKFSRLGYVTVYTPDGEIDRKEANGKPEIFTWNIYGGVKSVDETFGDLDEFISWRVALMELALSSLDISSATTPITATTDPYKITQVHDYKSISFLRQSASVKSASTETIKVFAQNYPELLKEKFFLNVPAVMGFVYAFIKLFVAEKTRKKFHPMSDGKGLSKEFEKKLGKLLPKEYGGEGEGLEEVGKGPLLE